MTTRKGIVLALSLLLPASLVAAPASSMAGILDSALPTLQGHKSAAMYTVTGVMNAAGLGTFFTCTNPSTDTTAFVSVELFTESGGNACNDASSVSVSVAPGATVMFATNENIESSFFSTQPLTTVPMFLSLGSARILATDVKALICNAFVADVYNSPPSSMMPLNLISRGKQKGD